jgi:DNA-binding SARP family transcriptional activator
MEFRILGPLEVEVEAEKVPLQGLRQRRLLGALLLEAGRVVPEDRLAEIVWNGEEAPSSAVRTMRTYLTRLRKSLGEGEFIVNQDAGYVLSIRGYGLDRGTFEDLLARARRTPDPAGRADVLSEALGLWRGPLLGEMSEESWVLAEAQRLDELRAGAAEDGPAQNTNWVSTQT